MIDALKPKINAQLNDRESLRAKQDRDWNGAVAIAPRLSVANNLRRHFELNNHIDPSAPWIANEADHRASAVSIGIELELQWRHILPDNLAEVLRSGAWHTMDEEQRQLFNDEAEPIGYPHQARCQETIMLGVPSRGNDGLWEFSHRPAWQYQTLVEEVKQLVDAGLVPEGKDLSLHITLGNVEADERACLLLRALEVAGGSSIERLLDPNRAQGWARRGDAGIARRAGWKLEFGHRCGVELRSLEFHDVGQLNHLLSLAQAGGNMIQRVQAGDHGAIESWQIFVAELEALWGVSSGHISGDLDPVSEIGSGQQAWEDHARRSESIALSSLTRQLLRRCVI